MAFVRSLLASPLSPSGGAPAFQSACGASLCTTIRESKHRLAGHCSVSWQSPLRLRAVQGRRRLGHSPTTSPNRYGFRDAADRQRLIGKDTAAGRDSHWNRKHRGRLERERCARWELLARGNGPQWPIHGPSQSAIDRFRSSHGRQHGVAVRTWQRTSHDHQRYLGCLVFSRNQRRTRRQTKFLRHGQQRRQPDSTVRWVLFGAACPSFCGSIDTSGNYTAPQILPTPPAVTLTAQSAADPSKQASVNISITSHFILQLAAPGTVATSTTAVIVATMTPVAGSNPSSTLNCSLSGTGCSGSFCGTLSSVTTPNPGCSKR
jgi:hypothetical protein